MKRIALIGLLTLAVPTMAWAAPDVEGLTRINSPTFDEVYVRDGWAPSGALAAATVAVDVGTPLEESAIGTRDLERLRSDLERNLAAVTGPNGSVALDVTLVELIPNRVLSDRGSRYFGPHESYGIGGAAMEAVFRDAATGETLMVILDERRGRPLTGNVHVQSRQVWGDANDIVNSWANELPQAL